MASTIELLTAVEVRQNGTDAAMYRRPFSFPDEEAKRSGVDHFALASYNEASKCAALPGESVNDCRANPQGTHSTGIVRQSSIECSGVGIPALSGMANKQRNGITTKTNPEVQRNQIAVCVSADVKTCERN